MKSIFIYFLFFASVCYGEIFLQMHEIHPGQLRYSSINVQEKINKKIERNVKELKGIPVVKACFGYVLIDGHHDVISSLALGVEELSAEVVKDLSDLNEDDFWDEMERQGYAYLYDLEGNRKTPPRDFQLLEDDPNRYFAAITARKYAGDLSKSTGAEYPLWIKIGRDIPFIEFKISDILWRNQIVYQNEWGNTPSEEFIEVARMALTEANEPGIRVVAERVHYSKLLL